MRVESNNIDLMVVECINCDMILASIAKAGRYNGEILKKPPEYLGWAFMRFDFSNLSKYERLTESTLFKSEEYHRELQKRRKNAEQ